MSMFACLKTLYYFANLAANFQSSNLDKDLLSQFCKVMQINMNVIKLYNCIYLKHRIINYICVNVSDNITLYLQYPRRWNAFLPLFKPSTINLELCKITNCIALFDFWYFTVFISRQHVYT